MVNSPQGRLNPVKYFFDTVAQEENRVTKKCKLCGRNYRASLGISSNFISHLKSAHKVEFSEFQRQYVLNQYQPNSGTFHPLGVSQYAVPFNGDASPSTSAPAQGGVGVQQLECAVQPYQMFFPQYYDARANTDVESSGDVKTEATEMDLSDSEDSGWPKSKMAKMDPSNVAVVKEENETLRFQLDAYKNEVNVIKNDMKSEIDSKDKQLHLLQQTLQNLQTQILDMSRDKFPTNQPATSTALMPVSRFEADSNAESSGRNSASSQAVSEREAKLIGVLTTFLHIHPMGAGIDYVTSYVQRVIERNIRHSEVEQVLTRYQNMFRQSVTGVGASMERKWVLTVFDNCQIRP